MAHFYGSMSSNGKEQTKCGTKITGITAHVRGWNVGARVRVFHTGGEDQFQVLATSGSNGRKPDQLLGTFRLGPDGKFEKMTPNGNWVNA